MSRIDVFSFHAQDALVPLCGDLHVRDVCYEIIKGTDFNGHNVPSDDQMVRDKDLPSASIHFLHFRHASARRDLLAAFPVQALDDSSIDRPSRNSASAVFPATSAASGERKPHTLTFTPIGVFL